MILNKFDEAMGLKASDKKVEGKNNNSFTLNLGKDIDSYRSIDEYRKSKGFSHKDKFIERCVLEYMKNHPIDENFNKPEQNNLPFEESTKKCSQCGKSLPLSNFSKSGHGSIRSYCKDCSKKYLK